MILCLYKPLLENVSETLYYKLEHPSGLTVLFIQKKTAILRMQYLEQNTVLLTINSAVLTKILFTQCRRYCALLEHKLFESEDGDAFARYAKTGASANAYTSFDMTCYLFSCTENVEASLKFY